jgi:hypothetical protein
VSFVLIAAAIAGTIFFLSPEPPAHPTTTSTSTPAGDVSLPTTTGADVGSASAEPSPSASASAAIRLGDSVEPPPKPKAPAATTPHAAAAAPKPRSTLPSAGPHHVDHVVPTRRTTPLPTAAEPVARPAEKNDRTDLFDTPSGLDEPGRAAPSATATTTTPTPAPTADPSSQF